MNKRDKAIVTIESAFEQLNALNYDLENIKNLNKLERYLLKGCQFELEKVIKYLDDEHEYQLDKQRK